MIIKRNNKKLEAFEETDFHTENTVFIFPLSCRILIFETLERVDLRRRFLCGSIGQY